MSRNLDQDFSGMVMAVLKLVLTCNTGEAVSNTTSSGQHILMHPFMLSVCLDLPRLIQASAQNHYKNFHGIATPDWVLMAINSSVQQHLHHGTD